MSQLLHQMEPMIVKSGCNMSRLELKDAKYEEVESGYRWLKWLFDNEYAEARNVRALLPESVWLAYELVDPEEFREIKMLNSALDALRKRINRGRPDYFKRKKNVKKDARPSDGRPKKSREKAGDKSRQA